MSTNSQKRLESRTRRHERVRKKVRGTAERPRLVVFKSARHIYAQLVNDDASQTITGVSTLTPGLKEQCAKAKGMECAKLIGAAIAEKAQEKKITQVVYDRGGFGYVGKIKAVAEAAREKGLKF
jgi:large subunit ribosomal protein L18